MAPKPHLQAIETVRRQRRAVDTKGEEDALIQQMQDEELDRYELVVRRWIETVLETEINGNLMEQLQNGQILCNLVNVIQPNIVKKIHRSTMKFLAVNNINSFLAAAGELGVGDHFIFDTIDLYEMRNRRNVIFCIFELARVVTETGFKVSIEPIQPLGDDIAMRAAEELQAATEALEVVTEPEPVPEPEALPELEEPFIDDFIEEPEPDYTEEYTEESNRLRFSVTVPSIEEGDRVYVVGDHPDLGEWNPENALELTVDPDDETVFEGIWNEPAETVLFKFVRFCAEDGDYEWEAGYPRVRVIDARERIETVALIDNWRDASNEDHVLRVELSDGTKVIFTLLYDTLCGADLVEGECDDETAMPVHVGGAAFLVYSNVACEDPNVEPTPWEEQWEDVVGIDLSYLWVTDDLVAWFLDGCPNLTHLNLEGSADLSPSLIDIIAPFGGQLQSLKIGKAINLGDKDVSSLAQYCNALTEFDFGGCPKITDAGLRYIAECLASSLERVSISDLTRLTEQSIEALLVMKSLQHVNLKDASFLSSHLPKLFSELTELNSAVLDGISLDLETIDALVMAAPNATHLSLQWCSLDDQCVESLIELSNITHLDLGNNPDLSDSAVVALTNAAFASILQEISLADCTGITSEPIVALLSLCQDTIKVLNLSKTSVDGSIFTAASSCPQLESLQLAGVDGLCGDDLVALAGLQFLKTLVVRECGDEITFDHIKAFVSNRPTEGVTEVVVECGDCDYSLEDEDAIDELREINELVEISV